MPVPYRQAILEVFMGRLGRIVSSLVVVMVTALPLWSAQPASAANPFFELRSATPNGWCLDADLNTLNQNGTKVQLWPCNGQLQQRWYIEGTSWRSAIFPNRCLDVNLGTPVVNGTKIQLWDCNFQPQQRWAIPFIPPPGSSVTSAVYSCYQTTMPNNCPAPLSQRWAMDADLNTLNTPGTKIQVWQPNGQSQQTWIFTGHT
jgi:hypothetical protein